MKKINFSTAHVDFTLPRFSITSILDMCEDKFDKDSVAEKTFNKNFNNPESEYYHKTVEEILEMWNTKGATSRKYGSLLDDYIGECLCGDEASLKMWKLDNNHTNDDRLQGLTKSFDDFIEVMLKSGNVEFVDREKTLYHKVICPNTGKVVYVRGRFDALFYNKKLEKWILIDWKSSGEIEHTPNKWTKNMLGPMNKYPQLNYYRYTNQLNFYKKTLVDDKYLPEGTMYDDVVVMIVHLPGKPIAANNDSYYQIWREAMKFNPEEIDQMLEFAVEKQMLLEVNKPKEEAKDETVTDMTNTSKSIEDELF